MHELAHPPLIGDERYWHITQGDAAEIMPGLDQAHTLITSPPYYGQRVYPGSDELGHENTPEEYVTNLCDILDAANLHPSGTMWLNLGDTYAGSGGGKGSGDTTGSVTGRDERATGRVSWRDSDLNLKPKDLMGIPWMAAFELRRRGWYLRRDIVWQKRNPKPDGARDRPTCEHEFVFLLSKRRSYYYDLEASKVPTKPEARRKADRSRLRNRRTVWTTNTSGYRGAHFATFPEDLIRPMVQAGTSAAGACAECGNPWERIITRQGDTVYGQIRDEHGMTADRLRELADERGLRATERAVGGTRLPNGQTPQLDGPETVTTGWQPSCHCDAMRVPCVVLDPFAGSGTVGVVALKEGRSFEGVDLSADYVTMARERIEGLGILA